MAIEDAERTLGQIRDLLRGPELTSVGQLIGEVRDAIRGSGQNTVRMAIQDLQKTMMNELSLLRDAYRGGGGIARPGLPGQPAGGPQQQTKELEALDKIVGAIDELKNEMAFLLEGHHGLGGGGGGTGFDAAVLNRRYRDIDNQFDQMTRDNMSLMQMVQEVLRGKNSSEGNIQFRYENQMKNAVFGLSSLVSETTNLINVFDRLGHFIKEQVIQGYQNTLANRSSGLTGAQTFFDEFIRLWHNPTNPGFSFNQTATHLREAGEAGQTPMTTLTGQSIAQMSQVYNSLEQIMKQQGHKPYDIFGGAEGWQKFVDMETEFIKNTQTFGHMDLDRNAHTFLSMQTLLSDISRSTGISADKLTGMAQANTAKATELEALGQLTPGQTIGYQRATSVLGSMGQYGNVFKEMLTGYAANAQNMGMFNANTNYGVAAVPGASVAMQKFFDTVLNNANLTNEQIRQLTINTAKEIGPLTQALGSASGLPSQYAGLSSFVGAAHGLSRQEFNVPMGPEGGGLKDLATGFNELTQKLPITTQIFVGLAGVVGDVIKGMFEFYAALRMLKMIAPGAIGEAGGGFFGGAGRLLGGAARFAGPVLGGAGAAIGAAANGAPTSGVIGAGVGGTVGAVTLGPMIGGALGTLTDWFTGPFGTIVGAALGSAIGGWLGEKGGETIGAAISPNENMVGPGGPGISGSAEDSALMAQILQSSNIGNGILSNIHGELARQTSLIAGSPTTNSQPGSYPAQGLAAAAAPIGSGSSDSGSPHY